MTSRDILLLEIALIIIPILGALIIPLVDYVYRKIKRRKKYKTITKDIIQTKDIIPAEDIVIGKYAYINREGRTGILPVFQVGEDKDEKYKP